MGEAVLELQGEGAAHRVQTVGGVDSGAQLRLLDRELRQQVELDRVAERLVDADAVLEDGDPLRQPEERGEAVKPRKRSVGWKRLVVVPSSVTAPRRSCRASAKEDAPHSAISAPPTRVTTPVGTRSRSTPAPGSGVTPTTSTRSTNGGSASVTSS